MSETFGAGLTSSSANGQDAMSSGLLISVIRTLTSSVSDDERQMVRSRLEKGYADSGLVIDRLLKEHQGDVRQCLSSFRQVSGELATCRERIRNVKNALLMCKSLLQCRRDDLRKLWLESAEQNHLNIILKQIYDIKHIDTTIDAFVEKGNYRAAVDALKRADIMLNGPLSQIEGLNQLRTNVDENMHKLFESIISDLLQCIIIVPFDCQLIECIKNLSEKQIGELPTCVELIKKYSTTRLGATLPRAHSALIERWAAAQRAADTASSGAIPNVIVARSAAAAGVGVTDSDVREKVVECLEALKVFDHVDAALTVLLSRVAAQCQRAVADLIAVFCFLIGEGVGDATHFAQLCQLIIQQINDSAARFAVLLEELRRGRNDPLAYRFWDILQDVLETVVSEHLEIWRGADGERPGAGGARRRPAAAAARTLFSFDNIGFVAAANSSLHKKQSNLICPASAYNVPAVFHVLNRFVAKLERELGADRICNFSIYLNTFVMDAFVERIRADLKSKTERILSGPEVWALLSYVPAYDMKVLTSCLRIFELCEMVNDFILKIGSYTQRFAALWLFIIGEYTRSATEMYARIIRTRSHKGERIVDCPKISATWAVDEDISRLLKSLHSWTSVSHLSQQQLGDNQQSPSGFAISLAAAGAKIDNLCEETEQDARMRTQRESEILIGNLGSALQIQRAELITDMEHVKSLACMHESLQWFVSCMHRMRDALPDASRDIIRTRSHMFQNDAGEMVEQLIGDALEERLKNLENMAETSLLMLYLEIRVHCFYHLLPLARLRAHGDAASPEEEQDREAIEFGKDLMQYNATLAAFIGQSKLKYLFAGLGHLCASIFINSGQFITKLTEEDRKRMCRNIFTIQKSLSQLSGRPESEMARAQTYYRLVSMDIDQILALVRESGESYTTIELTNLCALAVRSHPVLSAQPGALETILGRLRRNMPK